MASVASCDILGFLVCLKYCSSVLIWQLPTWTKDSPPLFNTAHWLWERLQDSPTIVMVVQCTTSTHTILNLCIYVHFQTQVQTQTALICSNQPQDATTRMTTRNGQPAKFRSWQGVVQGTDVFVSSGPWIPQLRQTGIISQHPMLWYKKWHRQVFKYWSHHLHSNFPKIHQQIFCQKSRPHPREGRRARHPALHALSQAVADGGPEILEPFETHDTHGFPQRFVWLEGSWFLSFDPLQTMGQIYEHHLRTRRFI